MSFWSWFTGREEKEQDVYANYGMVKEVTDRLEFIAVNEVEEAKEEIKNAINNINNVNGVKEYVGSINPNGYNQVLNAMSNLIIDNKNSIQTKAEEIKGYEETPTILKVGSSVALGICKIGEGLLSVFEDIGDGVVGLIGYTAGILGNKNLQKDCQNIIKANWSHDFFQPIYDMGITDSSYFTEKSGAANALLITGKVAGFLLSTKAFATVTGLRGQTYVGKGLLEASGSTWAGTTVAGLEGMGSGLEKGLNKGKTYNQAMLEGLADGTISAASVFALGKLNEVGKAHHALSNKENKFASLAEAWKEAPNYQGIPIETDLVVLPIFLGLPTIKLPNFKIKPKNDNDQDEQEQEQEEMEPALEAEPALVPIGADIPAKEPTIEPIPVPVFDFVKEQEAEEIFEGRDQTINPGVETIEETIPEEPAVVDIIEEKASDDPIIEASKNLTQEQQELAKNVNKDMIRVLEERHNFIVAENHPEIKFVHSADEYINAMNEILGKDIKVKPEKAADYFRRTGTHLGSRYAYEYIMWPEEMPKLQYYEKESDLIYHIASGEDPALTKFVIEYSRDVQQSNKIGSDNIFNKQIEEVAKKLGLPVTTVIAIFIFYEVAQYGLAVPTGGLSLALPG